MKYRVTVDIESESRRPDSRSDFPRFFVKKFWVNDFIVEGDGQVVVATLRAIIEKIEAK